MPRRLRLLAVLLAVAASATGVAACGGGGDNASGGGDAGAMLKATFGTAHPIRSGSVDAVLVADLQGLPSFSQPLNLHLSGPFQSNGGTTLPDFALELDLNGGTSPVTIGATFAHGVGYLTLEGQAFALGRDIDASFAEGYRRARADSASSAKAVPSLSALGVSPLTWLKAPRARGREDIAGTQTDHISAAVDVPRLLGDLNTLLGKARSVTQAGGAATGTSVPTRLTAAQRDAIARSVSAATVDVWTGTADRTLRKLSLDVRIAVPTDLQARAGGLRSGHIALQVTLAALNRPQAIRAPSGARSLGTLRAALGQVGLGSGASSATPGTATTPGTSTTPAAAQAGYARCLDQAGDDLAKVQRCGELLK
ncbi:hypothetical protein FSW04_22935 [Baekduia soli]|uniref:Uncharacterized protein n=1 Tax=Baekduia soli TaxID=496014 RepID=A0A5B8UAX2_9ACTN|nr:hypothetical protein [Baekduia soli]QEC50147.1 hypothetical protein FSW04_22935 [Baekduia soli]